MATARERTRARARELRNVVTALWRTAFCCWHRSFISHTPSLTPKYHFCLTLLLCLIRSMVVNPSLVSENISVLTFYHKISQAQR
jgi:hypothetical protein